MHHSAARIHAALTPQAKRIGAVTLDVQDVNLLLADMARLEAALSNPLALAELLATMLRVERIADDARAAVIECAEKIVGAVAAE